jgi:hypothetical protein
MTIVPKFGTRTTGRNRVVTENQLGRELAAN